MDVRDWFSSLVTLRVVHVLQLFVHEPRRVVSMALFTQVLAIAVVVEFSILMRRWEVYVLCLACQFAALCASFAWGHSLTRHQHYPPSTS